MSSSVYGKRVFVGNLHNSVNEGDLIKLFQSCGTVTDVNYMWHKSGPKIGQPKGFAFVGMSTVAEAELAIARCNGVLLKGKNLVVSQSENEHQLVRTSKGSNYSRAAGLPIADKVKPVHATSSEITKPDIDKASGQKRERSNAEDSTARKQKKELRTVEERMRRLQEALKGVA